MKTAHATYFLLVATAILNAAVTQPDSIEQIEERVQALKKPDVVWRKIAWMTCLVEALHESRTQNKPIVAWVFIDRPKDDERC